MRHLKTYTIILAFLLSLFFGIIIDSRTGGYTETQQKNLYRLFSILPSADPGINNTARYIRHLGLSTAGSAFPDFPGQPDYLPGGMMIPPPPFSEKARKIPLFSSSVLDAKKEAP